MKRLWAPWRMNYIESMAKHKKAGRSKRRKTCVFCEAQKCQPGKNSLVLYKGQYAFVILNKYPYTNGHLMVVPYRHLSDYQKLTADEHAEMGALMALSISVLSKVFKAEGFNLGMNLGRVAGAGIRDHLHYHVVPRWNGDHNCMPVVSGMRVLIEYLHATHQKLLKAFKELARHFYTPLSF